MISAFANLPALIKKETYLKNTPVYIGHLSYDTPEPAEVVFSDLHQHQFIEIGYVVSGTGTHRIWNQSYPVYPGDLYLLNEAVPHTFFSQTAEEPLLVRSLFFDPRDIFEGDITELGGDRFMFGLFAENNFAVRLSLKPKYLKTIIQRFDELQQENENKALDWQGVIRAQLTLLLFCIKRLSVCSENWQPESEAGNTSPVSVLLQMIHERYADPEFSLKSASRSLHRSTSSLSRSFFSVTGKHFFDYLCAYRMQQAASLLLETELPSEEIVLRCGYCDFSSFYKQFRKIFGTTPGEFRNQKKPGETADDIMNPVNNSIELCMGISEKLQQCRSKALLELIRKALETGVPAGDILNKGLTEGMNALGEKFRRNEVFVPGLLAASKCMNDSLELLKPYLTEEETKPLGYAVICTVRGDIHNIGKNIVKILLEGKGITCIDLGVNVTPEVVVGAVKEYGAQLVCLSALLTTTMQNMKEVIEALTEAGLRDRVKIMVGGAPVTQEFADAIGADCYTADAVAAAKEAKRLLAEMNRKQGTDRPYPEN